MEEAPKEELSIHKTVDHNINKSRRHRYAKVGEPLYKVCWYDFEEEEYTWRPTRYLPQIKIMSYYRKHKLSVPDTIEQAVDG